MIATQKGNIDATVVPAPLDLKAEQMGLKRLLPMGSILPIPPGRTGHHGRKN
jgi:hypothetical protein